MPFKHRRVPLVIIKPDVTGFQSHNIVEKIVNGIKQISPLDQRDWKTCSWCHTYILPEESFCSDECFYWDQAVNNARVHGELKLND